MFNIKTIRKEALDLCDTIVSCCSALTIAMEDFKNFKKSSALRQNIININNLEEDGDKIYTDALRNLYTTSTDAVEILSWTKIFDYLEKCCDSCEIVSGYMESVIMKNT